ncbi:MAG: tetratricopeptide repeat protein, partial [Candidatus Saccharibacteria bacterium]
LKKVIAQDNEIHPRHFYYFARESQIIGDIDTAIEYFLKFLEMPGDRPCHYTEACLQLASIYMERGDKKAALRILTRSFEFEPMRAEVLCLIGQYYRLAEDFATAIPWFELALAQTKPFTWEFIMHEYWDFIPCMELCHCYYWTGNHTKAQEYHERARRLKPSDPGVIYNQQFFNGITQ